MFSKPIYKFANFILVLLLFPWAMTAVFNSQSTLFVKNGIGICGDELLSFHAIGELFCAAACNQISECTGFSYGKLTGTLADGNCNLHAIYSSFTNQLDISCFIKDSDTTTSTTQALPFAITTSLGTTATIASLTPVGGPTMSASTSIVKATSIDNAQYYLITGNEPCRGNLAAIGILREGLSYNLICRMSPNNIAFQAGNPDSSCTYSDRMQCMSKTCGANSVMVGFMQGSPPTGPCSASFSGAQLDLADCHMVSGALQERPIGKESWEQWRICGGNDTNLYLMTEVSVSNTGGGSWDLTRIKCCHVK